MTYLSNQQVKKYGTASLITRIEMKPYRYVDSV